jgi:hypothetical protein
MLRFAQDGEAGIEQFQKIVAVFCWLGCWILRCARDDRIENVFLKHVLLSAAKDPKVRAASRGRSLR